MMTNNEQNKLLAGLVGVPCYHEAMVQTSEIHNLHWSSGCIHCGSDKPNTNYFADPPHSKIVELVGKAVEKYGYQKVNTAFENAARKMGMTDGFTVTVEMMDAAAKASVILGMVKEAENGD